MPLTVGAVAKLAHVSIRTLHHYHAIGLLEPSGRSDAGYRLYTLDDLEALRLILFYKELGFSLDRIRTMMADPAFDRSEALREQRDQVAARIARFEAMLGLIDKTLAYARGGIVMTEREMFEVFGDFDPQEHEAEVQERWGDTDAHRESARRTARYTKGDWQRFKQESDAINGAVAALMADGVVPTDERAMEAVERHRLQIDTWFYPCPRDVHARLGEMYVADPRFTATYERIRPGMARWLRDAIVANAAR